MSSLNINNQNYQINLFVPLLKDGELSENYGLYHASLNGEAYFIFKNSDTYQVENIKNSSMLDVAREETFSMRRKVDRNLYKVANENLDKIQEMVGKWQEEIKTVEIEKVEFNKEKLEQQRQVHRKLFYNELENWLDKAQCLEHVFYEIPSTSNSITYGLYQSRMDNSFKFVLTQTNTLNTDKIELNLNEFKEHMENFENEEIKPSLTSMLKTYEALNEKNNIGEKINLLRQQEIDEKNKTLKVKI